MSGLLLRAFLPSTDPSGHDHSDACYFIVMEHPLACVSAARRGVFTAPVARMLDVTGCRAAPPGYATCSRGKNLSHAMRDSSATPLEGNVRAVGADNDEEGFGVSVITVDSVSGQLLHTGVPQKDRFASVHDAISAIPALCPRMAQEFEVQTVCEFVAFAGGCLTDGAIHLLFVEASRLLAAGGDARDPSTCTGLRRRVPPILSVEKAQWYNIPLCVEVPALQQPLTDDGVHSWLLGPRSSSSSTPMAAPPSPPFAFAGERVPPYLFFSPGVDVTHCSVFAGAVRHCATAGDAGHDPSASSGASLVEFLPPLPLRTGRGALGQCDCLWNEELIAFCDAFGLGDWCCRLALGSCSTIVLPLSLITPHVALLVVRLSRLAVSGCLYDYFPESASPQLDEYFSTLETEFQLLILHGPQCCHEDCEAEPVSALKWRRGDDFAHHGDLIEQRRRFADRTARFDDSLPPFEDHIAGIFLSYMERYGSGTSLSLVHAGSLELQGDPLLANTSGSGNRNSSSRPVTSLSVRQQQQQQQQQQQKSTCFFPSPEGRRASSVMPLGGVVSEQHGTVDVLAATASHPRCSRLEFTLQSLAEHARAHSLRLPVVVGTLSWPPDLPPSRAKQAECLANEDVFLQTYWGEDGGTTSHSSRGIGVPENLVLRVCVSDDTETSIMASIIVSLSWAVSWACDQLCRCGEVAHDLREQVSLVNPIIISLATSAAASPRIRAACMEPNTVHQLRQCLMSMFRIPPAAFSPLVWATSQCVGRLSRSLRDPAVGVDGAEKEEKVGTSSMLSRHMLSFVRSFFISSGKFYPRELVRHRTVLVSHPSQLSLIIGAHMMALQSSSQQRHAAMLGGEEESPIPQRRRLFPFTPMKSLDPSLFPENSLSPAPSSTAGHLPTLNMLQGLAHPFSQPLLVPSCFDAVEFTVALPTLSLITHVAMTVANAVQEAPYAAVLALSLSTCCYVGQAHERVVLEDLLLPLCVSCQTDRSGGHAAPRIVFFELHRPSRCTTPFSVLEDANAGISHSGRGFYDTTPVIARFLRFSMRGSGCAPMALPPVLVFGEPIYCIPRSEQHAVVGRRTTLGRMLRRASRSPYFVSRGGDDTPSNGCVSSELPHHISPGGHDLNNGDEEVEVQSFAHAHRHNNTNHHHYHREQRQKCHVDTLAGAHERQEVYVHMLSSAIPADLSQLNLALVLDMESKRLQCLVRRHDRELCLHRIGAPRWVMNPACQVFPHSAFHRSRLLERVEDITFIEQRQRSPGGGHSITWEKKKREERKRCAICSHRFSWFSGAKECDRCQRHVCKKCLSEELVSLPDLGLHAATARVCPDCLKKVSRLGRAIHSFLWSESEGEVDAEVETEESIDFYTRCTIPRLASTLASCSLHCSCLQWKKQSLTNGRGLPYQLTMYPLARVVSAPGMDDAAAPLFEEVLGVAGIGIRSALSRWHCVSEDEWTESTTRVSRHVVVLLPHHALVSHGVLHYALAGKLQGVVEVQMHVGNSLKALHLFHAAHIGQSVEGCNAPGAGVIVVDDDAPADKKRNSLESGSRSINNSGGECLTVLELMHQRNTNPPCDAKYGVVASEPEDSALLVAIFFIGSVTDLALLRVHHFSVWGRFAPKVMQPHLGYYKCRPDACRYGSLLPRSAYNLGGVLGLACLPRMLPMTRLIAVRSATVHTQTEQVLLEFDFGVPSTVCGFTLELHHPAAVTATHSGIATALRLIGVLASGYRGNMGYFQLPWPPLSSSGNNPQEVSAYAYSLPSTCYNIVSVLVEVLEWRLAGAAGSAAPAAPAATRRTQNMVAQCSSSSSDSSSSSSGSGGGDSFAGAECSQRRDIYLGKVHFWTSTNAAARRMVSSRTYFSMHAALDEFYQ